MKKIYDVIGVGVGPFNLSVLTLLYEEKNLDVLFFDKKPYFSWHEGMLIENTYLQNTHLKDLTSLSNPQSKFSFLSFLHHKKRIYEWLNSEFDRPLRQEYNQYLKWVCELLNDKIQWNTEFQSLNILHPV